MQEEVLKERDIFEKQRKNSYSPQEKRHEQRDKDAPRVRQRFGVASR